MAQAKTPSTRSKTPAAASAAKPRAARKPAAKAAKPSPEPEVEAATLRDQAGAMADKVGARARDYATTGKNKAGDALAELAQLATSVADTVDHKVGGQYGDYVRKAAGAVSGAADTLKTKEVDELVDDARTFVRERPAVAIGAAAAIGFMLIRMFKSGSDDRSA